MKLRLTPVHSIGRTLDTLRIDCTNPIWAQLWFVADTCDKAYVWSVGDSGNALGAQLRRSL